MKKVASVMIIALLFVSMLSLAFHVQPARTEPATITVPDDYVTIQEAIENANEGDTIFVRNGMYYENVIVYKRLRLIGESKNATILDGNGNLGNGFYVTVSGVNITGFTIRNYAGTQKEEGNGVCIYGMLTNVSILNNIVENNRWGIHLRDRPSYCSVVGNILTNNSWYGIYLEGANYNDIEDNNISRGLYGILVESSSDNIISENTVENAQTTGVEIDGDRNIIDGNEIFGSQNGWGLLISGNDCIVKRNVMRARATG